MKKNGEYVGVDEKFIPENEKYVEDSPLNLKDEKVKKGIKTGAKIIVGWYLFVIIIFVLIFVFVGIMMFKNIRNFNNTRSSISNNISISKKKQEQKSFNMEFEFYAGECNGSSIKSLITTVKSNNANGEHNVTINGVKTLSEVDSDKDYNVDMEYDKDGYIYEINITEI